MLVTTSFNDSQVMYWEPAKWVAKLRATKTDHNPLYFKINLAGGHGGSSGRYNRLREIAFRYAFMLDPAGLAGGVAASVSSWGGCAGGRGGTTLGRTSAPHGWGAASANGPPPRPRAPAG